MAGTKEKKHAKGVKREMNSAAEPPTKKAKLLDNTDDEGSDDEDNQGGVSLKVNEDYARRFEYNKKRAELHRRMSGLFKSSCIITYSAQWKKSTAKAMRP